jgi:tripartite-type tricarboxylate transporter receptor subunit TctC
VKETGVVDFVWDTWAGYFAPARTPAPVLARLRHAFDRVAASAEVQATLQKRGVQPIHVGGRETEEVLARDLARWVPLIREAGLTAD